MHKSPNNKVVVTKEKKVTVKKSNFAEVEQPKYDIDQVGTGFFDSDFYGPVRTETNMYRPHHRIYYSEVDQEDKKADIMDNFDFSRLFKRGMCPDVQGMKDLKPEKLSGDWFLQATTDYAKMLIPTSCAHLLVKAEADGSFEAIEEMKLVGKDWVAQNLKGELTEDIVSVDFFDDALTKKVQVLGTNYDCTLMVECYDN